MRRHVLAALASLATALPTGAHAASHLWVINELFSTPDGSIQFVEMFVPFDANFETQLQGKYVSCDTSGSQFTFPENLTGGTAFAYLLLGTKAFAALPGAPTPDYILPEGFFDLTSDTVRWWLYGTGDLSFGAGMLPLDGVNSLHRDLMPGPNTPTNFAGETGTVDAGVVAVPTADARPLLGLEVTDGDVPSGIVSVEISASGQAVTLRIFDSAGRIVRDLFRGTVSGFRAIAWDGRDDGRTRVGSGIYLVRLADTRRALTRKVTILR